MRQTRGIAVWTALLLLFGWVFAAAVTSPLLEWRQPVYIGAGVAGVAGMALIVLQPLLATVALPGVPILQGRKVHRWVGGLLVLSVVLHVAGLWITSPPDVIDVLLFRSPTPFSVWGTLAMWALFATGVVALLRQHLKPRLWRRVHMTLATVIVVGSVVHAMLIEGTMGAGSKAVLCLVAVALLLRALAAARLIAPR